MKIIDYLKDIKYGIRNLWRWFPIIWNDRDWDYYYIFKLLKFKFKNMEYNFRNYAHIADADKVADELKVCQLLLDRLIKDEYYGKAYKWHDERWGKAEFNWEPIDSEYSKLDIKRKFVITDKDEKQERKEYMRLYNHEGMLRKQDIEFLFHIITRKILGWWD